MSKPNNGHWVGMTVDTTFAFGFIYMITDLTTGHKYVGRKQIWMAKPAVYGCKSRVMDRGDKRWKASCWKEGPWRVYKGSSKSWAKHTKENPDHEYEFRVLKLCRSKGVLSYNEAKEMWDRRVLESKLPDGSNEYFNEQTQAIRFRPKADHVREA